MDDNSHGNAHRNGNGRAGGPHATRAGPPPAPSWVPNCGLGNGFLKRPELQMVGSAAFVALPSSALEAAAMLDVERRQLVCTSNINR